MTKKKKNKSVIPSEVRESAQKIWLAGLGAVAMAEDEGEKLFKNLVQRGEEFEKRSKKRFQEVQGKVEKGMDEARDKAESTWTKVEETIDDKVSVALKRLGVPTRQEIQKLTKRVEELTVKIDQVKTQSAAKKTTRKSSTRAKSA